MQENENANPLATNKKRAPNKGFRIWLGDTYIGYMNIGEKQVPAETVAALQNPQVMAKILADAELRPYAPDEMREMSNVEDIIAGVARDAAISAELTDTK